MYDTQAYQPRFSFSTPDTSDRLSEPDTDWMWPSFSVFSAFMLIMTLTLSHVVSQRERGHRLRLWGNGPSPGSIWSLTGTPAEAYAVLHHLVI